MSVTAIRLEMDTEQMQKIFGMQDAYIKKLEQDFQVTIVDRNGSVMITGKKKTFRRPPGITTADRIVGSRQ